MSDERLVALPGWMKTLSTDGNELHLISLTGAHLGAKVSHYGRLANELLTDLAHPLSSAEVLKRLPDSERSVATALLAELRASGVIGIADEEFQSAVENNRYLRQLEYFEDSLASQRRALDSHRNISSQTFGIIGVGGVGTWVLLNLAMVGARRFILIDPDRVELSNLSRQLVYSPTDVGRAKVDAAADWIRHFEPDAEVSCVGSAVHRRTDYDTELVGASVVIRTAGYVPSQMGRELNRYALDRGFIYTSVGGTSWGPLIGGASASELDGCLGCFEQKLHGVSTARFAALEHQREQARETHSPVFGPTIATTASLAVRELILDIAGIERAQSRGAVRYFDRRMQVLRSLPVPRSATCPDCGSRS